MTSGGVLWVRQQYYIDGGSSNWLSCQIVQNCYATGCSFTNLWDDSVVVSRVGDDSTANLLQADGEFVFTVLAFNTDTVNSNIFLFRQVSVKSYRHGERPSLQCKVLHHTIGSGVLGRELLGCSNFRCGNIH